MSLTERFTDAEILLLNSTPMMIGSSMVFAEGSGLGTFKELLANAKTYIGGAKAYPDNAIINGILPNLLDHEAGLAQAKDFRDKTIARFKEKGINSPETLKKQLLEDCQAVATLLTQKATEQEASEYKAWAMSIAENVAKAAKEGGFLGFGGQQISAGEQTVFAEVAAALGTTANMLLA